VGSLQIEDLAGRDDLVAGVIEGAERHLEVVGVLGLHVLPDTSSAPLTQILADHHGRSGRLRYPATAVR